MAKWGCRRAPPGASIHFTPTGSGLQSYSQEYINHSLACLPASPLPFSTYSTTPQIVYQSQLWALLQRLQLWPGAPAAPGQRAAGLCEPWSTCRSRVQPGLRCAASPVLQAPGKTDGGECLLTQNLLLFALLLIQSTSQQYRTIRPLFWSWHPVSAPFPSRKGALLEAPAASRRIFLHHYFVPLTALPWLWGIWNKAWIHAFTIPSRTMPAYSSGSGWVLSTALHTRASLCITTHPLLTPLSLSPTLLCCGLYSTFAA